MSAMMQRPLFPERPLPRWVPWGMLLLAALTGWSSIEIALSDGPVRCPWSVIICEFIVPAGNAFHAEHGGRVAYSAFLAGGAGLLLILTWALFRKVRASSRR